MNTHLNHAQDWLELARKANWSISEMAARSKVSVRTLERHFLKAFGKGPKAWLTEQRQKQVLTLRDDGYSVKEMAALLGYSHASNFTRALKNSHVAKLGGTSNSTLSA